MGCSAGVYVDQAGDGTPIMVKRMLEFAYVIGSVFIASILRPLEFQSRACRVIAMVSEHWPADHCICSRHEHVRELEHDSLRLHFK